LKSGTNAMNDATSEMGSREDIAGVPLDPVEIREAVRRIDAWVKAGARPAAYVVQANAWTTVRACEDKDYFDCLASANLCVADGMPLVWLLRRKGRHLQERVYGPDLMLILCERAAKEKWRCFLYGGKPGVPETLRDTLVSRYPELNVAGTYSPPFQALTAEEDAEVCAMVNAAKPDILWVGLGSPKQDLWMHEHRDRLNVSVMHGVGAAFDFLSGRVRQAPRWMMNAGLEWLFRLIMEPRRLWKRYTITNLKFLYYIVTREIFKTRS
jgi:N-acetylglucosaminyldiphosphoundecaprenol N-acetyl-beta-D-mannosaminyltransferase